MGHAAPAAFAGVRSPRPVAISHLSIVNTGKGGGHASRELPDNVVRETDAMAAPQEYVQRSNRVAEKLALHDAAGVALTGHLVFAADEAVSVLGQLLEDQEFWSYLQTKKVDTDQSPDPYASAVSKHQVALLKTLGYRPPPPVELLVDDVARAIIAARGTPSKEFQQVKDSIRTLQSRTSELAQMARKKLIHKATPLGSKTLGERLKKALIIANTVVCTGAAVLALKPFDPIWPQKEPVPIVQPAPAPQLPPNLQAAPPGSWERGPLYFYKGLPPPPDIDPGPPQAPRKT
jgi:hypothetical protein